MLKLRDFFRKHKMNNQAMTLIEVLAAMAILAVVLTPTLRMFASSSSVNLRAKWRQRATTAGESVMESFKAFKVEGLCKQFKLTHSFRGVNGTADMDVEAFYDPDPGTWVAGAGSTPFHVDNTLNTDACAYRFWVNNATSEGSTYDIDVWVTPRSNPDVLNFEPTTPNEYADAVIMLGEMTLVSDGSAVDDTGALLDVEGVLNLLKKKAKDQVLTSFASLSPSIDDVTLSDVKRTITVNITDNAGASQQVTLQMKYECKGQVKYHYTPAGGTLVSSVNATQDYDESLLNLEVQFTDGGDTHLIYDNSGTIGGQVDSNGKHCKLNNVYLYYYPDYKGATFGDDPVDEIYVNATLGGLYDNSGVDPIGNGYEPLNVIIAKQVSTMLGDVALSTAEFYYDYKVVGSVSGSGEMVLLHNYDELLKDTLTSGYTSSSGRVSGFTDTKSIKEGFEKKTNLIYDVDVKVYQAGTGRTEELAEFTGTINE